MYPYKVIRFLHSTKTAPAVLWLTCTTNESGKQMKICKSILIIVTVLQLSLCCKFFFILSIPDIKPMSLKLLMADIFAENFFGTCFHVTVTHLDRHLFLSQSHMKGISLTHISALTYSFLKWSSFRGPAIRTWPAQDWATVWKKEHLLKG